MKLNCKCNKPVDIIQRGSLSLVYYYELVYCMLLHLLVAPVVLKRVGNTPHSGSPLCNLGPFIQWYYGLLFIYSPFHNSLLLFSVYSTMVSCSHTVHFIIPYCYSVYTLLWSPIHIQSIS